MCGHLAETCCTGKYIKQKAARGMETNEKTYRVFSAL